MHKSADLSSLPAPSWPSKTFSNVEKYAGDRVQIIAEKTAPNLSRHRLLLVLLLACMVIDIFCYRGSQFDSGIFSDAGQSDQLVLHNSVSMLERLDSLEKKLSSFSSKVGTFSPSNTHDKARVTDTMEDLEMKQLLFRKLTMFKNKRVQEAVDN